MENLYRNYFLVYQNKTYHEEYRGGFLWSPQYTTNGRRHSGYEAMKEVRKGDMIFHSYQGKIVAISRAKASCVAAPRPSRSFNEWDRNGWRIETEYLALQNAFYLSREYIMEMYKIQPSNGPFNSNGGGKQQYLCNLNLKMYENMIDKILKIQYLEIRRNEIIDFLNVSSLLGAGDIKSDCILLDEIMDGCKVDAILLSQNKTVNLSININERPNQKNWLGKKVGDILTISKSDISYRVQKIYMEEL